MREKTYRPTLAEINLSNLESNLESVKQFVGPDKLYMAVVKADAYGHGAVECATRLEHAGVDWFGVAIPEEGIELRQNGITKPILCLGGFWPGQEEDLLDLNLIPTIFDLEQARLIDSAAEKRGIVFPVHVKIDTGMGRVGVPLSDVSDFVSGFLKFSHLELQGLMTHFAAAENLEENTFTREQISGFKSAEDFFHKAGLVPEIRDLANSPGAVAHPEARADMVRLGGVIYGLGEDVLPQSIVLPELDPVLSLYSGVAMVKRVPKGRTLGYGRTFTTARDSIIATVPIGYQDGYMRLLSNKANAIVRGELVPVVGRISMDWTIIDVTDVPGTAVGDRVTLIGSDGENRVTAADLARLADTISYEITCGLDKRVKRVYVGS